MKEAMRLFECDAKRRPYTKAKDDLVVSPVNARKRLTEFIAGDEKAIVDLRDEDQRSGLLEAVEQKDFRWC